MVTKEIKKFVISQMKLSNWTEDHSRDLHKYKSKHIDIRIPHTGSITFTINMRNHYSNDDLVITRKELGLNLFNFWYLIRLVKKSSKNAEKRIREKEISNRWNQFLERNKDLKRDNKLNKILD